MKAKLSTDGGSRGNPGPAAYGYVLEAEDGTVLDTCGETIGVATNNVAEYRGLIEGLRKAVDLGVDELEVVSDSELIVRQMTGEYKVKNGVASTEGRSGRPRRPAPEGRLYVGSPGTQRAGRQARQRGLRRRVTGLYFAPARM